MKRAAALLALLLAGCDAGSADGYRFERKEWERAPSTVTIVTHPTLAHLRAAAPPDAVAGEGRENMAWSVIRGAQCEVHIVDPGKDWMPEWLGHEVAHCAWGRWHP